MNKMFTATAAMQLVEASKLSLDDTSARSWPTIRMRMARKVTIRHLLITRAAPAISSDRSS